MSGLVVVPEVGEVGGAEQWREAFGPEVHVVDLPGHGAAPAPVGGHYELFDPVFSTAALLEAEPAEVLVGVGRSGWSAQMLAIGGRARRLALVDGLGGPWVDPAEVIAEGVRWVQSIAADPAAVGLPPAGQPDPRLRHGVPAMRSRRMAERAAAACPAPVLIVETPASPLDSGDVDELAALYRDPVVVRLDTDDPAVVAEAVLRWR